jgi:[methyl-Co(III) methanol-specific corrinoid protein]:coenzyme M methyltransferase
MLLTGCVNNPKVLLGGTVLDVAEQTKEILDAGILLVSPECAVPCAVPNENLKAIAETVISYRAS